MFSFDYLHDICVFLAHSHMNSEFYNDIEFNTRDDNGRVFINRQSYLGQYKLVNKMPRLCSHLSI